MWWWTEEEGHKDNPGTGPESDGPTGDAGEGGSSWVLCDQQQAGHPTADVSTGVHTETASHRDAPLNNNTCKEVYIDLEFTCKEVYIDLEFTNKEVYIDLE